MTFKVGDKVRRVSNLGNIFKDENTIWEVSHISKDEDGKHLRVAGCDSWFLANRFLLVEPPSIPGIPAGYRAVRYGRANKGDWYLSNFSMEPVVATATTDGAYLIVEHCELTNEQAEAAYDAAVPIPMSKEEIDEIVQSVVAADPPKTQPEAETWPKWAASLDSVYRADSPDLVFWVDHQGKQTKQADPKYYMRRWNEFEQISEAEAMKRTGQSTVEVPAPQPPAESPEDWVEITDPEHVLRADDEMNANLSLVDREGITNSSGWLSAGQLATPVGLKIRNREDFRFRCRRRDLPVEITDPEHVLRKEIDEFWNSHGMWCKCYAMAGLTVAASGAKCRCLRRDLPVVTAKPATKKITFHRVVLGDDKCKCLRWVTVPSRDEIPTGETCVVEVAVKP